MPNLISIGNYNTSSLFFPFCVFLLCKLNKLLEQSTQTKFSLFLISVSAETPRQPRTRRKRKSTNANSSAPSSGMNSTSGKKKSPSTSGFTLASQDVMVVGEPSLMGGEFGDEDERLITRWVVLATIFGGAQVSVTFNIVYISPKELWRCESVQYFCFLSLCYLVWWCCLQSLPTSHVS